MDILETIDKEILTKENEEFYKRSVDEFLQDVEQKTTSEESKSDPLLPDTPADYDTDNDSAGSQSFEEIQEGEFDDEEESQDESLPSLFDEEEKVKEENEKWN